MRKAGRPFRRRKYLYSKRRRRPVLKVLLAAAAVLACASVVYIGYSVEPAIANLLSGKYTSNSGSASSAPESSDTASETDSAASQISSASGTVAIRGITLPESCLSNTAALESTASAAASAGVNLAVVTLKDENGIVAYNSQISEVSGGSMVASGAPDAAGAAQILQKYGITPAAKISCFKDPVAPLTMFSASILYSGDHSMRWLDSSGNRWLNPYNDAAQQYIIDLVNEAISLGYKQIYLDNMEFPEYDAKAYYGENLPAKEAALTAFAEKVRNAAKAKGATISVVAPGRQSIGQGSSGAGQGQTIYAYSSDYYTPNLCPALLGLNVTIGGTAYVQPDLTPDATVASEAACLSAQAGFSSGKTVPFIQAFTDTSLGSGGYTTYTAAVINAEISALRNAGITNYILHNPSGAYDFSGLSLAQ